jgi:hypothetical protein
LQSDVRTELTQLAELITTQLTSSNGGVAPQRTACGTPEATPAAP